MSLNKDTKQIATPRDGKEKRTEQNQTQQRAEAKSPNVRRLERNVVCKEEGDHISEHTKEKGKRRRNKQRRRKKRRKLKKTRKKKNNKTLAITKTTSATTTITCLH
mgnify:CR=1 FL=1